MIGGQAVVTAVKTGVKQALWRATSGPDGLTDVRVLAGPAQGARMRLDLRCEGSYWLGTYDRAVLERLCAFLRPGGVAWDCGAYLGYYAAAFRRAVGAAGNVHAFEASSHNLARVAGLPAANDWRNVRVHHLAVGEAHSQLRFAGGMGATSRPASALGDTPELVAGIEHVACAGIDELAYGVLGLPAPDVVKLDLEGAEVHALANGERLWAEKRPVVLVELHCDQGRVTGPAEAAERWLREARYTATEARLGVPIRSVDDVLRVEHAGHQCTLMAVPS